MRSLKARPPGGVLFGPPWDIPWDMRGAKWPEMAPISALVHAHERALTGMGFRRPSVRIAPPRPDFTHESGLGPSHRTAPWDIPWDIRASHGTSDVPETAPIGDSPRTNGAATVMVELIFPLPCAASLRHLGEQGGVDEGEDGVAGE